MSIKIALADDHTLIRKSIRAMLEQDDFQVVCEASNGKELIEGLKGKSPQVVVMDVSMPVLDGVQTTLWLKKNMPDVHVLALSMMDDDTTVIRMIRAGARGYVLKDVEPRELRKAIRDIADKGYYYSELVTGKVFHSLHSDEENLIAEQTTNLTERELEFLKHCCSEMSYKQIADAMVVSPRTVDGYRDALFDKLEVKSRIGLVLYATKSKLVQ